MKASASTSIFISAAIGLGLASSGCSFAFSRGPSPKTRPDRAEVSRKCSTSIVPPVFDSVFTGTHLAGAAWGINQSDSAFDGKNPVRDIAIGADLALAALHLGSAIYGYAAASECREARRIEAALEVSQPELERQTPASTAPRGTVKVRSAAPASTAPQGTVEVRSAPKMLTDL